jgi:hypothetical protein
MRTSLGANSATNDIIAKVKDPKELEPVPSYQDNMTLDEIKVYDEEMTRDAIKNAYRVRFHYHDCGLQMVESAIEYDGKVIPLKVAQPRGREYQVAIWKAQKFTAHCIDRTLQRLGVKVTSLTEEKIAGKIMTTKKVKIESRDYYEGDEKWKNGVYIYHKDVLVAFISEPFHEKPSFLSLDRSPYVAVVTNVRQ